MFIRTPSLRSKPAFNAGFTPLTNAEQVDFGSTRFVLDPNATSPARFYRVKISLP